jgi:hypothetical protein
VIGEIPPRVVGSTIPIAGFTNKGIPNKLLANAGITHIDNVNLPSVSVRPTQLQPPGRAAVKLASNTECLNPAQDEVFPPIRQFIN